MRSTNLASAAARSTATSSKCLRGFPRFKPRGPLLASLLPTLPPTTHRQPMLEPPRLPTTLLSPPTGTRQTTPDHAWGHAEGSAGWLADAATDPTATAPHHALQRRWLNLECCGVFCAGMVYLLLAFADYVVTMRVLLPWLGTGMHAPARSPRNGRAPTMLEPRKPCEPVSEQRGVSNPRKSLSRPVFLRNTTMAREPLFHNIQNVGWGAGN